MLASSMVVPATAGSPHSAGAEPAKEKPPTHKCDVPGKGAIKARVLDVTSTSKGPVSVGVWDEENVRARTSNANGISLRKRLPKFANMFQAARLALAQSAWYHSRLACKVRTITQGKLYACLMVVALLLALFMPSIWVIAGVNANAGLDVVLTLVMFLFVLELIALTAVDAAYCFSFFFVMDIIGTICMIFDISYMLGSDNTAVQTSKDSGQKQNITLLRALRAAKVGARAGRLSRMLRYVRFLPFISNSSANESTGIASTVSGQLSNLLATRVACLTIILVMVIPQFDIWTFPSADYSLQTWAERISDDLARGKRDQAQAELIHMVEFFDRNAYGPKPYKACIGFESSTSAFDCQEVMVNWNPSGSPPSRMASSLLATTSSFMIAFNLHKPISLEAGLAMATIFFIIFIMVFSGLALSNVVTELAVRPLERMLDTVRQIATTVFRFTAEVAQGSDDDEATDVDNSSEMKLLEKVVQKLAVIADLQTRKNVPTTADMQDEDIGILSMMEGKNIVERTTVHAWRSTLAVTQAQRRHTSSELRIEDFGLTEEQYDSWGVNTVDLNTDQKIAMAFYTILNYPLAGEGFITCAKEEATLQRFITACDVEYPPNPFHNFGHAVDVTHAVSKMMRLIYGQAFLTDLEQFSLLIAAIAHDLSHPGVNNGFLSEIGHELALQYNDRSPLENMHCAKLYMIVAREETNVFSKLTQEQYRQSRKKCIEAILHTDMMGHQAMVKDLQMMLQMNSEIFTTRHDGTPPAVEMEVFSSDERKMLVLDCILHSADVSNPCRTWEVTQAIAHLILEEFFAQGDQEKMRGIPVQFLNDRENLNRPNSQIGFIEFMIAPFFAAQIRLWPKLHELGSNLATNVEHWERLWVQETTPVDEERQKVRTRVERVAQSLEDARLRIPS